MKTNLNSLSFSSHEIMRLNIYFIKVKTFYCQFKFDKTMAVTETQD